MKISKAVVLVLSVIVLITWVGFYVWSNLGRMIVVEKPVIYLYPSTEQKVSVKLAFDGNMICTYPKLNDGAWHVIARPDGSIYNLDDHREYSYLFWEGSCPPTQWDLSTGFVVRGQDTQEFLRTKLSEIGLTPKEYNDFIVYWLPQLQNNTYNLIHFEGKTYENMARLEVEPKPDSVLRVFMVYKPVSQAFLVEPQALKSFERTGFTVVEWGGAKI